MNESTKRELLLTRFHELVDANGQTAAAAFKHS